MLKEKHLMDVYKALGLKWGDDPFSRITRMRESIHPDTLKQILHDSENQPSQFGTVPAPGA